MHPESTPSVPFKLVWLSHCRAIPCGIDKAVPSRLARKFNASHDEHDLSISSSRLFARPRHEVPVCANIAISGLYRDPPCMCFQYNATSVIMFQQHITGNAYARTNPREDTKPWTMPLPDSAHLPRPRSVDKVEYSSR